MNKSIPVLALLILAAFSTSAEEFVFKHVAGDKYRIVSTVSENVYVNNQLFNRAEILNRIAVTVDSVQNGQARHSAIFNTAEKADSVQPDGSAFSGGSARSFAWSKEYRSVFDRDSSGAVTISEEYFMPVVRNVPFFPPGDIKPGDAWTAEGHEVHDFRDGFGIQDPYRIPFVADYSFLGSREWKGKQYPAVSVKYTIVLKP
jgi:hypothetical protein